MDQIQFTVPEILSLIGMTQCVYLVVHLLFKSGPAKPRVLPLIFFFSFAMAFLLDAAASKIAPEIDGYFYVQWFFWFLGPLLSVLLVHQISDIKNTPPIKEYWVLLLLPLSLSLSHLAVSSITSCQSFVNCEEIKNILNILGFMSGVIALLIILSKYQMYKGLRLMKSGRERYWLIISFIILNSLFLGVVFLNLNAQIGAEQTQMIRTIIGAGFVYLVGSSVFKILPEAKKVTVTVAPEDAELSASDQNTIRKIERLFTLDKIYQEPSYSRTDLAQECGVSETVISKLINIHYQKSFPQLMNEYRIDDAKQLLEQTNAPIKVIASEVGFNSLPSFNRAFKESLNLSPSAYREGAKKAQN